MKSMHLSTSAIQHHIEYNTWATHQLLSAVAELHTDELTRDFGTADKSVLGTLVHIFRAERIWLARLEQRASEVAWSRPEDEQLSTLKAEWPPLHNNWRNWANSLSDSDTERVLSYTDLRGNPWAQPVWQIALHVVNHSTHHRGQVSGFLRAIGKAPPPLDFIRFVRENASSNR
jgi:uncharacterized damage-inducible protein DinB